MKEIRKKKLEKLIYREVSNLIMSQGGKDDRIGLVSVTRVDLAPDLSTVTVFISPFGSESENKVTWSVLKNYAVTFQSRVSRNLRLRLTPKLVFSLDNSIKEGDRLLDLMD